MLALSARVPLPQLISMIRVKGHQHPTLRIMKCCLSYTHNMACFPVDFLPFSLKGFYELYQIHSLTSNLKKHQTELQLCKP